MASVVAVTFPVMGAVALAGCGPTTTSRSAAPAHGAIQEAPHGAIQEAHGATKRSGGRVLAVAAENEYANVIAQVGGPYVAVKAVMSNPNTDPHDFEASTNVASMVGEAQLVVQNGLGYDSFMDKIEAAAPNAGRQVIDVQKLRRLPSSTANPHLWYSPQTMPMVAQAVAADLGRLEPAHRKYFTANVRLFDRSLQPWLAALGEVKAHFGGVGVATTEPVADYMLEAAGTNDKTPWTLQADLMNGVDPAPQAVSLEEDLFRKHEVRAFVYNEQVTDSLSEVFLSDARHAHIPVVAVYETMPVPGYDYQSWMLAEVNALLKALSSGQSTARL